jgi:hypothetical protein
MIARSVQRFRLGEQPSDLEYWLRRPMSERLDAVEELRSFVDGTSKRLERVVVVVELSSGKVRRHWSAPARFTGDLDVLVEPALNLGAQGPAEVTPPPARPSGFLVR